MATNIDYEVIRLFNEHASEELIQSDYGSYICCYCNKIAVDIYSVICECKYCQVCVENKLELKSHKCDGMKTKECHEVNLKSFDDYEKDIPADKRLMNKEVRCCFCEKFTERLKNMTSHLNMCKETLFNAEIMKSENKAIRMKMSDYERNFEAIKNKLNEMNCVIEEYKCKISALETTIGRMEINFNEKLHDMEKSVKCKIEEIHRKVNNQIKSKIGRLKYKFDTNMRQLQNTCKVVIEEMQSQINNKTKEYQNKLNRIEDNYEEINKGLQLVLKNENWTFIKFKTEKNFLWIIKDIERKTENSIEIWSPEFYTNSLYKMRLRLDTSKYQDHLSLYFFICSGEYDDEVIWPYASTVKFELVNFKDSTKNKSHAIVAATNVISYQKPNTNLGYGITKFHNNKELFPDFIKNNSIWIRFYPNI